MYEADGAAANTAMRSSLFVRSFETIAARIHLPTAGLLPNLHMMLPYLLGRGRRIT